MRQQSHLSLPNANLKVNKQVNQQLFNDLNISQNLTRKKWLAYFDLLGFSEFVKHAGLNVVVYQWGSCLESFVFYVTQFPGLQYAQFSDTFIIYAQDDSGCSFAQIEAASRWFFNEVLIKELPLRGTVACDEFYGDKQKGVFLGKALVLAHEFSEQFNWIGLTLSPSAIERIRHPEVDLQSSLILNYRVWDVQLSKFPRLKKSATALFFGNGDRRDYIVTLNRMKHLAEERLINRGITADHVEKITAKYDNTIQFIEANQNLPP